MGGSSSGFTEAFRWTSGGGMVGLGELAGGESFSDATGVSADGATIVGDSASASGREAFRWTSGGGMVGLGDLPGRGFRQAKAADVSADGAIVVGSSESASGREAFIWDAVHGMRELDLVLAEFGLGPAFAGWTLTEAHAISDDGLTIVGFGINPSGQDEAWLRSDSRARDGVAARCRPRRSRGDAQAACGGLGRGARDQRGVERGRIAAAPAHEPARRRRA